MSATPRTDAVNKYLRTRAPYTNLRTRDDYTKTDHEVWMDHSCDIESKLNTAHESLLYARGVHIQKQIALDKANHRIRHLESALRRIANTDYRGNRSTESQIAFEALKP